MEGKGGAAGVMYLFHIVNKLGILFPPCTHGVSISNKLRWAAEHAA